MRARFFRFWVTAGAMWAAVCSFGNRLQAMQAETENQQREFVLLIDDTEEDVEQSEAPKFWLGISLKPVEGDLAKYLDSSDGVLVDSVYPESPASAAGLVKGDIIVAIGDQKLTDPKSLLTQMLAIKAGEDGKASAMTLKVLRKGESKSFELTPVVRPPEVMKIIVNADELDSDHSAKGELALSFDLNDKSPEEIEKMIEKLHGAHSDVRILRFGTPAKVPGDSKTTTKMEIHQSVDGKKLEIKILREGDGPAKVTVIRDGETKQYSSDKMEEIPEDVRKKVKDMLEDKGQVKNQGFKPDAARDPKDKADSKGKSDDKQANDRLSEKRNRIALIAPKGLSVDLDKEMAEKIRTMAKEIEARAHQSTKWAHAAAAMPEEIKELKSQVDALRAELKELREQLKSTAKQTGEK